MASRNIKDACEELQNIIPKFKDACADIGVDVLVYCIWRGEEEQNQAYAQGKSKLKFPNSKHNCVDANGNPASRAFDAAPTKGNTILWGDSAKFDKMGKIAEELGLEWGGSWKTFKDKVHFQLRN